MSMLGVNFTLGLNFLFFSFLSNSLSYITIPKTKENKLYTKDEKENK